MPVQREVTERYWTWCRKWGIPYPCRKTRTVVKWCYAFSYLTVDYHGVYTNYVGCEFNDLYSWRQWELTFRFESFTLYFVERCYSTLKTRSGSCTNDEVVLRVRRFLQSDEATPPS